MIVKKILSVLFLLSIYIYPQGYQPTINNVITHDSLQHETAISVNPNNPQHLLAVWNDFRNFIPDDQTNKYVNPGYAFSTDGGTTWTSNILTPNSNFPYGFDPSCSFDNNGYAY
ncbi:MAG: hypothetical protein AB1521_17925 [Bacteroidota bacterium]